METINIMNLFYLGIITLVNTICVGLVLGVTAQFHSQIETLLSMIYENTRAIRELRKQVEHEEQDETGL